MENLDTDHAIAVSLCKEYGVEYIPYEEGLLEELIFDSYGVDSKTIYEADAFIHEYFAERNIDIRQAYWECMIATGLNYSDKDELVWMQARKAAKSKFICRMNTWLGLDIKLTPRAKQYWDKLIEISAPF